MPTAPCAACCFPIRIGAILAINLCNIALESEWGWFRIWFMWQYFHYSILFCLLLALPDRGQAQTASHKWAGSLGFTYLSYRAPANTAPLQYTHYDPGVSLSVDRYLSGAFAFSTRLLVAPQVRFPVSVEGTRPSYLIDMSYLMMFKLNNGSILRENARIGPYFTSGIGGSYVEDRADVYVPLGGGIQVRISPRLALRLQSVRKISINKDYQHTAHAAGLVYAISGKKAPQEIPAPEPEPLPAPDTMIVDAGADTSEQDDLAIEEAPLETPEMMDETSQLEPFAEEEELTLNEPLEPVYSEIWEGERKEWTNKISDTSSIETEIPDAAEVPTEAVVTTGAEAPEEVANEEDPWKVEAVRDTFAPMEPDVAAAKIELKDESGAMPPQEESTSDLLTAGMNAVYFEYGSDQLQGQALEQLAEVARVLKTRADARLVLYGHTDAIGSDQANQILSVMRAFNVKYFLVHRHKITQSRITSEGYGEKQPKASNDTADGRGLNRRVDFEIMYTVPE